MPGRWTHLAGTYDGAVLRIYVDGAPAGERPLSGALRDPAVPLRIGAGSGATPESPFHGEIDDVRLYGRALSAPEIRALAAVEAQDAAAPSHDGRNGDGGLNDRLCGALGWEGLLALLARRRRTSARRAFRAT